MRQVEDRNQAMVKYLHGAMGDEAYPPPGDLAEVGKVFVKSYLNIARRGYSGSAVAIAMLGASLNVFDMFGIRHGLPELLRDLADSIEHEGRVN